MISDVENLFMYFLTNGVFFGKMSMQILCSFLKSELSWVVSSLYTLDTTLLLHVRFIIIISH